MSLIFLKASLLLWKRRLTYRKRMLADAREDARATPEGGTLGVVTAKEAQRIKKWQAHALGAERNIARRQRQIAAKGTRTYGGSPIPGQRPVPATHQTAGLGGYPAVDYFAAAGTPCVSPVTGKVTRLSGHHPAGGPVNGPHGPFGWSVYIQGGGKTYFLTHMGTRTVREGQHVKQGERIGTVANYARWGGANHIHQGVHG